MDVEIRGIEAVLAKVEDVIGVDNLITAVERGCQCVVRDAKQNAPKDTGELRRSIQYEIDTIGDSIEGTVFAAVEYAPYVEYGTGLFAEGGNGRQDVPWSYQDDNGEWHSTKGQRPQPFLRPAFNANKEKIIKLIKEGMK